MKEKVWDERLFQSNGNITTFSERNRFFILTIKSYTLYIYRKCPQPFRGDWVERVPEYSFPQDSLPHVLSQSLLSPCSLATAAYFVWLATQRETGLFFRGSFWKFRGRVRTGRRMRVRIEKSSNLDFKHQGISIHPDNFPSPISRQPRTDTRNLRKLTIRELIFLYK